MNELNELRDALIEAINTDKVGVISAVKKSNIDISDNISSQELLQLVENELLENQNGYLVYYIGLVFSNLSDGENKSNAWGGWKKIGNIITHPWKVTPAYLVIHAIKKHQEKKRNTAALVQSAKDAGKYLAQQNADNERMQQQIAAAEMQHKTDIANLETNSINNQNSQRNEPTPPKSKVGLYVGIGVGALVVIGGGFALYKHFSN